MKNTLLAMLTAAALAAPASVGSAYAGQKNLPPAFGKELVPSQESTESSGGSAEVEERMEEEKEEQAQEHPRRRGGGGGGRHGGRVHIQLDGGEDGGGDDIDGDF